MDKAVLALKDKISKLLQYPGIPESVKIKLLENSLLGYNPLASALAYDFFVDKAASLAAPLLMPFLVKCEVIRLQLVHPNLHKACIKPRRSFVLEDCRSYLLTTSKRKRSELDSRQRYSMIFLSNYFSSNTSHIPDSVEARIWCYTLGRNVPSYGGNVFPTCMAIKDLGELMCGFYGKRADKLQQYTREVTRSLWIGKGARFPMASSDVIWPKMEDLFLHVVHGSSDSIQGLDLKKFPNLRTVFVSVCTGDKKWIGLLQNSLRPQAEVIELSSSVNFLGVIGCHCRHNLCFRDWLGM